MYGVYDMLIAAVLMSQAWSLHTRSVLKLSTSIHLEHTDTCAVYQHMDNYSDSSCTSEDDSEPVVGSCTASEAGGIGEETTENWD